MSATFWTVVVAILVTLGNLTLVGYWKDLKRQAEWWVKYKNNLDRKYNETMRPWQGGYLNGLRAGHDIFRKQFDRALRKDTKAEHPCEWRQRMFGAKSALEAALDAAGPKDPAPTPESTPTKEPKT